MQSWCIFVSDDDVNRDDEDDDDDDDDDDIDNNDDDYDDQNRNVQYSRVWVESGWLFVSDNDE